MADASKDKNDEDARYKNIPFPIIAKTYKANAGNLALTAEALKLTEAPSGNGESNSPNWRRCLMTMTKASATSQNRS